MVMQIRVTVKGRPENVLKNARKNIDIGIRQSLLDLSLFIMQRAKALAPVQTGKLRASIGRSVGKRRASVFQKPSLTKGRDKAGRSYGLFQEKGVSPSSFSGGGPSGLSWRYSRTRGKMVRARSGQRTHPGVPATRFMERATLAGRRQAKRIFGKNIKLSLRRK